MNIYTPYSRTDRSITPEISRSPLRLSKNEPINVLTPRKSDIHDPDTNVPRRTIRIGKDQDDGQLLSAMKQKELSFNNLNFRNAEQNKIGSRRGELDADHKAPMHKSQTLSIPAVHHNDVRLDSEGLKQLINLQLQIQENPNIILQAQNMLDNLQNSKSDDQSSRRLRSSNLVHVVTELEQEVATLRKDNSRYQQQVKELEYELQNTKQQLGIEKTKTDKLATELDGDQDLRDKLDECMLEITKISRERDFHHKNHIELRKEHYSKTSAEFHINRLKRELHYKDEELAALRNRCTELEDQVNELLVFAEKPRDEKQHNAETFYAKRIVELENLIKKLKDEKFELENFNGASFDKKALLSEYGNFRGDTEGDVRSYKLEIEGLKLKVEALTRDIEVSKRSRENAQRFKGEEKISIHSDNVDRQQQLLSDYTNEIERLKLELRRSQIANGKTNGSRVDDFHLKTIDDQKIKINLLQQENSELKIKIDTLNRELMSKIREISELKHANPHGASDDTAQLKAINNKMMAEISRLQEQLRRMESVNKASMASTSYRDKVMVNVLK